MVKISNKILLAGGLATAIGLTACGKYEDGPNFSLLTKTQRLTGDWEVTKFQNEEGTNLINLGYDIDLEFDKDGDFKFSSEYNITQYGYTYSGANTAEGEWEFSDNKEEIELDYDDGTSEEWEITRLTNKELEGDITENMKKKLFPELELNSKSSVRIEAEKK